MVQQRQDLARINLLVVQEGLLLPQTGRGVQVVVRRVLIVMQVARVAIPVTQMVRAAVVVVVQGQPTEQAQILPRQPQAQAVRVAGNTPILHQLVAVLLVIPPQRERQAQVLVVAVVVVVVHMVTMAVQVVRVRRVLKSVLPQAERRVRAAAVRVVAVLLRYLVVWVARVARRLIMVARVAAAGQAETPSVATAATAHKARFGLPTRCQRGVHSFRHGLETLTDWCKQGCRYEKECIRTENRLSDV